MQEEKYTDDVGFYEKFAEANSNFTIDEVTAIIYSEEQMARLGEVQGLPFKHFDEISEYVLDGKLNINSEIFMSKALQARNKELEDALIELAEIVAESEEKING